jgi:hypothetical protein
MSFAQSAHPRNIISQPPSLTEYEGASTNLIRGRANDGVG